MINWELELAERTMLLSLAERLPQPMTFFDVGANMGSYCIPFAQRFPASRVLAFEPIHEPRAYLCNYLEEVDIKNVEVCPYGLADVMGDAVFYTTAQDSGATSLAPLEQERFGSTQKVPGKLSTLDYVCSYGLLSCPSFIIKCDVEGAELLVFKGAATMLVAYRPLIQCEMLRKWSRRFNYHPNDLIAFLAQFGYQCFSLGAEGKLVLFEVMTEDTIQTNFFFLHPEKHKELLP